MSNTNRQPGYYRVLLNGEHEWSFAEWDAMFRHWWITGNDRPFYDKDMRIDPTPIDPNPAFKDADRESAIREAAHLYLMDKALHASEKMAFIQGAKWADENPLIIENHPAPQPAGQLTAEEMLKPHIYHNVEGLGSAVTPETAEDIAIQYAAQQTAAKDTEIAKLREELFSIMQLCGVRHVNGEGGGAALVAVGFVIKERRQLAEWKKEQLEVFGPLLDYGQNKESGLQIGASIVEEAIKALKERKEKDARIAELEKNSEHWYTQHLDRCRKLKYANIRVDEAAKLLRESKSVIATLKRSMSVHPDCTEGSEFDDFANTAQEIEDDLEDFLSRIDNPANTSEAPNASVGCPHCTSSNITPHGTNLQWYCKDCGKQFGDEILPPESLTDKK